MVEVKDLIQQAELFKAQLKLSKYSKNQIRLLIDRIVVIITHLAARKNAYDTRAKLQQISNCLDHIKHQLQPYMVSLRFFYLVPNLNGELFAALFQALTNTVGFLGLTFELEPQIIALNQDKLQDQLLINHNMLLLKNLLAKQLGGVTYPKVRVAFLFSNELRLDERNNIDLTWDQKSDEECYHWLTQHDLLNISYDFLHPDFINECAMISLIHRSCFIDHNLQIISFKECWYLYPELRLAWLSIRLSFSRENKENLTEEDRNSVSSLDLFATNLESQSSQIPSLESSPLDSLPSTAVTQDEFTVLKDKLEAVTFELRQVLANNLQEACSLAAYWQEYRELHEVWIKKVNELPIAITRFSQASNEPLAKKAKKTTSTSKKIMEEKGSSLLQLNIPLPQDLGASMQFFIAVSNKKAALLLEQAKVTELDFEEEEIIDLFDGFEEITEAKLTEIKAYFMRSRFNMRCTV